MKKLVLSASLIVAFVSYVFLQRKDDAVVGLNTANPSSQVVATPTPVVSSADSGSLQKGKYKDGQYTGIAADAYYGNIQVKAIIQNGVIADVQFLQYPNDRGTSIQINEQAMPYLKSEAIKAQSARVNIISGATDSSRAFEQSLGSALTQAETKA